jgi:pilus assembly protein FimV
VLSQSAAIAPAGETRSSATEALKASVRNSGAEAQSFVSGDARGEEVEVQPGDTASEIAVVRLPPEVSLDQMLVALLRRNPDVFGGGNVNRMPAGAILKIPDARMALAIPLAEARRIIAEQNREYEAFRAAQAERFRTPLNGRSNRVEVLAQPVQAEAIRPKNTENELTSKAPGELTRGGVSEKIVASTVRPPMTDVVEPAAPALEPSPPLSPESPPSPPVVAAERTRSSGFFGGWLWVLGIAALAVAWGWFRAVRKAQATEPQQRAAVAKEPVSKSEPQPDLAPQSDLVRQPDPVRQPDLVRQPDSARQPDPAPILVVETPTLPRTQSIPSESAPDQAKAPAISQPPSRVLKPAGVPSASRTAAVPQRVPIPKPVDTTASSLPEPGRRQRLQEEAEVARLMAALRKEQAYQSDLEQVLENRIRRLAGLIGESERRNRKEGFVSRSYRWLLMALSEPGLKDNDPQRDLKLRLLIEIRDFNRVVQGRVGPVTQQP